MPVVSGGLTRFLYSVLSRLAPPFVWVRLLIKGRREPAYRERRRERLGHLPAEVRQHPIWFHTVSAGETIAAAPVIADLRESLPQARFLVTATTATGSAEVCARLSDRLADTDHTYAPYDFPSAVRRFLDRVQPIALVIMETELWPNIIEQCARRDIPIYLVNARLSERSALGYARMPGLTQRMLQAFSAIVCQYEDTAARFADLGASEGQLVCTGSVKFDIELPPDLTTRCDELRRRWLDGRQAWIVGSSHEGEDEVVLDAHRELVRTHPDLMLVLVPRHPHRAADVIALAGARGLKATAASASSEGEGGPVDVLVGDEMGSLIYLYGIAEVAFLAGSLDDTGGHNPIEAAVHGLPMLMGPNRDNFMEVARRFEAEGCLHLAQSAEEITQVVGALLDGDCERSRQGERARVVVDANRGARRRVVELMTTHLSKVADGGAIAPKGSSAS